jgi:hypothetical protein
MKINMKFCSIFFTAILSLALVNPAFAQDDSDEDKQAEPAAVPEEEQDDVSKALDSTATQWSFQFAYQQTSWKDDLVNGQPRQPGLDNFFQARIVAPLVFEEFTILPRLTFRHYENEKTASPALVIPNYLA